MILFFNWKNLVKESNNNPIKILEMLADFKKQDKILKPGLRNKLIGNSYLLNYEELFADKSTDILYKYQYLLLAAKRDYSLFKLYGMKSLPLSYYPDINIGSIRTNPLLTVTNTEITFKYEE